MMFIWWAHNPTLNWFIYAKLVGSIDYQIPAISFKFCLWFYVHVLKFPQAVLSRYFWWNVSYKPLQNLRKSCKKQILVWKNSWFGFRLVLMSQKYLLIPCCLLFMMAFLFVMIVKLCFGPTIYQWDIAWKLHMILMVVEPGIWIEHLLDTKPCNFLFSFFPHS